MADIQQISGKNFGIVVAFLIPGFIGSWGISYLSPTIRSWLFIQQPTNIGIPALFYVLLLSISVGMTVSAVRWALIDTLHHYTGLKRPEFNFANLKGVLQEFETINEHHYRFYQYYANTMVAIICTYTIRAIVLKIWPWSEPLILVCILFTVVVLFIASRNSLGHFYRRTSQLLGIIKEEESK